MQTEIIIFSITLLILVYLSKQEAFRKNFSQEELKQIEKEVRILLSEGHKIEAIKRVRKLTKLGLKGAKEFVEAIESGKNPPIDKKELISSDQVANEVRIFLSKGMKMEAIKRVRELTNVGLKDAKEFVEEVEKNIG